MMNYFTSLEEICVFKQNPFFFIRTKKNEFESGNKHSYYNNISLDDRFSFDVSNNKVLANLDERGGIRQLCFYRSSHYSDDMPGVWVHKDYSSVGPYRFVVETGDKTWSLDSTSDHDCRTDLLDNLFPRAVHTLDQLKATVFSFAPVSVTGQERLRALVYILYLESSSDITGRIILPKLAGDKEVYEIPDVSGALLEDDMDTTSQHFNLISGQTYCLPFIFYAPGEFGAVKRIRDAGILFWLNETRTYFRKMLGTLTTVDPRHGFLWERCVMGCFNTIAMDPEDNIAGGNWGANPPTGPTWMKDLYYAFLPFCLLAPDLIEKGILWFAKYGVRPRGTHYTGGVSHSLGNSLAAALLSGIYYQYTGNGDFFTKHPDCYEAIKRVLSDVLDTRIAETWLFPSTWISDALSLGIAHTGSNICAWKAFDSIARVAEEVFHDQATAASYRATANLIRVDIDHYMVNADNHSLHYLEGIGSLEEISHCRIPLSTYQTPAQKQALGFLEGVSENGFINLAMHDGEESDTTLMNFYGFKDWQDPLSRDTAGFAASNANPTYSADIRGIRWDGMSGATFPGFTTAYWATENAEDHHGGNGRLTELLRLTDLDGSWWWWPYAIGAKAGDVGRNYGCGKCGWAHGVFTLLYATQTLGISVNEKISTLVVEPKEFCDSYEWKHLYLGNYHITISYNANESSAQITNEGKAAIEVNWACSTKICRQTVKPNDTVKCSFH